MSEEITPRRRAGRRVALELPTDGGANQADRDGADLNNIMAQYLRDGTLTHVSRSQPLYGDFSGPQDLQSQMETVEAAQEHFDSLPAEVRALADNDPCKFVAMAEDSSTAALLEAAGLVFVDDEPIAQPPPSPASSSSESSTPAEPATAPPEGGNAA